MTPYVLCSRESQCSVGDCSYVFSSRESVFEFYFQCFRKVAPLIISFPVYRIYHKFSDTFTSFQACPKIKQTRGPRWPSIVYLSTRQSPLGWVSFYPTAVILTSQVNTLMKFRVSWLFSSGEEVRNRFSSWQPWRPSWISNQNDFSCFRFTSHPNTSYQVSSQLTKFQVN